MISLFVAETFVPKHLQFYARKTQTHPALNETMSPSTRQVDVFSD